MLKMPQAERDRLRLFLIGSAGRSGIEWDSPEARDIDLDHMVAFVMTRFETPTKARERELT